MSGSNECNHDHCGKYADISLKYVSAESYYSSIVDNQIDNIKYHEVYNNMHV
jgi:hypothetical protein